MKIHKDVKYIYSCLKFMKKLDMAQKNREFPPGYMDGVCVKISEKYKPPKRILLPTNNTQRITADDVLCSPSVAYDFSLEMTVKDKIQELQAARCALKTERTQRLKNYQERTKDKSSPMWNKVREADNSELISDMTHSEMTNTNSVTYPHVSEISCPAESIAATPTTTQPPEQPVHVLVPETAAVLTPTPMSRSIVAPPTHTFTTPINISDFENDTASPFDNMELKTLNDLAELAQVLQQPNSVPLPHFNHTVVKPNATYTNHFIHSNNMVGDSPINGYYSHYSGLPLTTTHSSNIFNSSYKYITESQANTVSPPQTTPCCVAPEDATTISRSVPDIMNALQKELIHSRVEEANAALKQMNVAKSPRASLSGNVRNKSQSNDREIQPNPYSTLTPRLQQITKEVSLMGFPLDRVARASAIIGDDQPRLVEHMIAMSQLLDLGFSEREVTKALLRYDNDRDKALDFLVS